MQPLPLEQQRKNVCRSPTGSVNVINKYWQNLHLILSIRKTYLNRMAKFGAMQRLRSAYRDGRLEAIQEAWMEVDPDFSIDICRVVYN